MRDLPVEEVVYREKTLLQKISSVIAIISFGLAIIGMLFLIIVGEDLGMVYKSSAGATTFFCAAMGVVFKVMGDTRLPILKVPTDTDNSPK